MATISFTPGKYELSLAGNGALVLKPLPVNNQESFVPLSQQTSNRQFPIIRKPSMHFYTSTLGLAGGIGFIASCVWSILLPAIGSVGVVAFAYLVDRKITLLYAKELSSEAAKSQDLFTQKIGGRAGSENLLDKPIDTDNLPPPMLPASDAINPITHLTHENNKSNILPPPPPPPPLSNHALEKPNSSETRNELLEEIRNWKNLKLDIKDAERSIKKDPEKYPSNLLFKELKATYERALAIGESELLGKTYFKDKVDNFEKNFAIVEQKEGQATEEMEGICKKASHLNSLLNNMRWARSLLRVLSEREGLSDENRKHCSGKLKSIDKHIEKLQRRNEKKAKEGVSAYSSQYDTASMLADMSAAMSLRRADIEGNNSSSSSENPPEDEENWE